VPTVQGSLSLALALLSIFPNCLPCTAVIS
jgi:hypothetical protein